jgi:hypothetical protein
MEMAIQPSQETMTMIQIAFREQSLPISSPLIAALSPT